MGLIILLLIISVVEALFTGLVFIKKNQPKLKAGIVYAVWISVYAAVSFFSVSIFSIGVKIILLAAVKLILYLTLFEEEMQAKLRLYGIFELMMFVCQAVCFGVYSAVMKEIPNLTKDITITEVGFLILFQIVLSAAAALQIQLDTEKDRKVSGYIFLIQLFFCFSESTLLLYIFSFREFRTEKSMLICGVILVLTATINILTNIVLPDFIERNSDYQSSDFNQKITEMEYEYYTIACENNRKTREMKHDIANHIQTLYFLLRSGEQEKGLEYIKDLSAEYNTIQKEDYCDSSIVNIILMTKRYEAQQKGIDVSFNVVSRLDSIGISDMDLSTVICNLLDNAIRGCVMSGSTYPKLSAELLEKNGYLVIRVVNSCDSRLVFDGETKIKSTKEGTQSGGFGMSIIMRTVKKYKGDFIASAQNGLFTATAIMSVNK